MNSDEIAMKLHAKFSQGETLSAEEHKQLQEWYAIQDVGESKLLGLTAITKRIQEAALENEDQEREFWATHDSVDYIDWQKAKPVKLSNLRPR
jgi:CopG antitoxin of type II toxin-antitoxin system